MSNTFDEIENLMSYEEFYRVIDTIPSNIFFKDTDLKYLFSTHHWNQVNDGDIAGKTDFDIRRDKKNALIAMEADKRIIQSGVGCKYLIKSEVDDQTSYLELIKEPVFSDDGKVIGIAGLINDETEKTLLSQEVEMANEELRSTLEAVRQMSDARKMFMASMNHELRTPLNGIIGMLQLALREGGLSETQLNYISNAYRSSVVMLELVNELLDFAKMETDEFKIRKEPFCLDEMLSNVQNAAEAMASAKGLSFKLMMNDDTHETFCGDELRINQVINNIVSNAIKYTDEGSVVLKVDYADGKLVITCSDTGQGIGKEAQELLFKPFVRINESKNRGIQGTGLGLSIVKRIVDKMDGQIQIQSEIQKGTTFTITLPLEKQETTKEEKVGSTETTKITTKETTKEKTVDLSTIHVLCIDDTKVNLMIFEGLLKSSGIHLDKAASGLEGIKMAATKKYDIIFMDHQMPNMDGVEALQHIREDELNKTTPVVVLTGNVGVEFEKQYEEAGFNGYLSKPIIKEKLLAMIDSLL